MKGYDGTSGMIQRKDFQGQGLPSGLKITYVQYISAPAASL